MKYLIEEDGIEAEGAGIRKKALQYDRLPITL